MIYNPSTQMQEMIRPWKSSADHETSQTLVREALAEELDRYPVTPIERSRVKFISLELKTVDQIETTLYPTAFYCSSCHKLYAEDPGNNDKSASAAASRLKERIPKGMRCTCGGGLIQWRVLTVHECGDTIHVPTYFATACTRHGREHLYFENHGSERIRDWEIVCKAVGCNESKGYGVFFRYHSDCPLKGHLGSDGDENYAMRYETAPIQKATNFIPRVLRILNSDRLANLPRGADKRGASALALGALRAGSYFSSYSPESGMDGWLERFDPKGSLPDPRIKELKAIVETMKDGPDKVKMLSALTSTGPAKTDILNDPKLQDLTSKTSYLQEAASISVYQDRNTSSSISDKLEDPTLHPDSVKQLKDAESMAKKLKFSCIRHVEDIALTSCLVGYTRGDYDPSRVILHLYASSKRGGPLKYAVYTDTVRTEAIFVQLDPTETLRWIEKAAGREVTRKDNFTSDLFEIQKKYDPSSIKMFRGPEDAWSRAQYILLHTTSHLLIRALGKFSGLEQEGLTERLYPYQNGFVVYSNQNADFSLGGLAMAFEHNLADILDMMIQDSEVCPYNPECETQYGACPACVYLAEISCENFNRVLDRRKLAPSKGDSFWH